ncbi:MAG: fumarylacetoacetate hydrolase family protein [Thermoplasmata archaeon]|nr:fumarylacetoacetate hydrolase family protein [Thermoplasmata archaeon]
MPDVKLPMDGDIYNLRPSKIIALARNYPSHAGEMGSKVPERVVFFLKPPSSLLPPNSEIVLPKVSREVHHEVELALIIGKGGRWISREKAHEHIQGYTILLDITARDLQAEAKRRGMPWAEAKGFDTFAPIGPKIVPASKLDPGDLEIGLKVNGSVRQLGRTSQMVFSVAEIIEYVSRIMTLEEGDIIATGTPEGVGPLKEGDEVEAWIEGIGTLKEKVVGENNH